ncbi:hypothetical protein GYMC10_6064 [Paenibacillus sp. Y412MC10]|nr:hypothetical protein GYMC10_6064 [Paenibacillus sp. Y412MC10]
MIESIKLRNAFLAAQRKKGQAPSGPVPRLINC